MGRGSEWNIWDLHVHTPASIVHQFVAGDDCDEWENYIRDLERLPAEVKVLGINDYLFIDGYRRVKEYKEQGRLQNIDLLLPVVEFRLSQFGGNKQFSRVNFHVIFSDEVSADIIQSQFLNALSAKYELSPGYQGKATWSGIITRDSLYQLGRQIKESVPEAERVNFGSDLVEGFNNLNLAYKEIMAILRGAPNYFDGKYLTAIGKTEWEDIKWNDNSIAEKKNIINSVNFVFTAAESVETYNAGLDKLTNSCVNNLLLDCSDAHHNANSTDKDRIGNCHCWIKAETTFEGLKQVLYEPKERKTVSLLSPQNKNTYQIIDHVILDETGFWRDTIPLNPNLNTIIGGRATGKSTLLKAMAAKHTNVRLKDEGSFVSQHLGGVKVIWADGAEHPENQIDFFPQNYMHKLAEDEQAFNAVLKSIITEKDEQYILGNYEASNNQLKGVLTHDILLLFQNKATIETTQEKIRSKGNKVGIVAEVNSLKAKLLELSKGTSLTEEEIIRFQSQSEQIAKKEKLIVSAEHDVSLLVNSGTVSVMAFNYLRQTELDTLEYGDNSERVKKAYEVLTQRTDLAWNTYVQTVVTATRAAVERLKAEIATIRESELFKKGLKFYADNKEIGDLKAKIQEEEKKVAEIEALEKELSQYQKERTRLLENIVANHLQYHANVRKVTEDLHFETDGLVISAKYRLRKEELCGFLEETFNLRSYERQEYLKRIEHHYEDATEVIIREFLTKALADEIALKNYNDIQQVTNRFLSENWNVIDYELQYQEDTFKEMSSGKQAFVILKLLLDFSDKKNPILIDQPEDSLDNRAIYNELVTYIVRKKKERQIILVTHNPNVVVGSDSENVIVANQAGNDSKNENGCKFEYVNGALEYTSPRSDSEYILKSQGIREHVCEILEGGEIAFIKREQKYGFR